MLRQVGVYKGISRFVGVFCGIMGACCFGIIGYFLVCWLSFALVCLNMFACDEICLSTFFDVLVCFCMLCSLLDILAHHVWMHFSKSTLFKFLHFSNYD